MKLLYYLPLLLLVACTSSKPRPAPMASEPIAAPASRVDSVVVVPHRSLLDKVLGRTPDTSPLHKAATPYKVGKKSTVSVYYGPATVTTVTTGKKAAPVVVADSGAAVHLATSGTGIAQAGNGNTATMPPPAPKPSLWQRLKWPVAGLGAIAATVGAVYLWPFISPAFLWVIALFRRKKDTDTTTV